VTNEDTVRRAAQDHVVPLGMLNELERQLALGFTDEQADAWLEVLGHVPTIIEGGQHDSKPRHRQPAGGRHLGH
jgi:hypothetical protein